MSKMAAAFWPSVLEQMPMLALCMIGLGLFAWLLFRSRIEDWLSFRRVMSCWRELERRSLQEADGSPFLVIATVQVEGEEQVARKITIWRGKSKDEAKDCVLEFGSRQAHRRITVEYSIHDGESSPPLWSWTINDTHPGRLFCSSLASAEST